VGVLGLAQPALVIHADDLEVGAVVDHRWHVLTAILPKGRCRAQSSCLETGLHTGGSTVVAAGYNTQCDASNHVRLGVLQPRPMYTIFAAAPSPSSNIDAA